jgi:hypothetical protein
VQTVTIYKAPQKRKGQKFLKDGFHPPDFPHNPPNADGKCYFAAPSSRNLAQEYCKYYKDGILEVTNDCYFKPLEKPYQGGPDIELAIPHKLFLILNQFPRFLKPE